MKRHDGRGARQLRPTKATYGIFGYADGSVLFEVGNTKILCAVSMETGVPFHLRGKGLGWLTAEYAMLPAATLTRTQRESRIGKQNGRSIEISRLIGRSLRSVTDLTQLGERTIYVDCDVLQADGGTRCAALTGAFLALQKAQAKWLKNRLIRHPIITDLLAAVSVGVKEDSVLLDVDYIEDSNLDADFNLVMTRSGKIIELQGSSETSPIAWSLIEEIRTVGQKGIEQLSDLYHEMNITPETRKKGFTLGARLGDKAQEIS